MTDMELNKALASAIYPGVHQMEVRKAGVIKLKVGGEVKTVDYRDGNFQKELCEEFSIGVDLGDPDWVCTCFSGDLFVGASNHPCRSTAIALCAIEVLNAKNKAKA